MNFLRIETRKPAIRRCPPAVVVSVVLFVSGVINVSAEDPFVWTLGAPCPLVRFEGGGGAAAGKLYQFSGFYRTGPIKATVECDAYDPATDAWTRIADIPQAISHCGQVVDDDITDDQIFWLAGGLLGDYPGPSTQQVWKYSINNNVWSAGPPLPDQRGGRCTCQVGT